MQGPLAQMVALVCHGNAVLRGHPAGPFLRANSTCQFCESVTFVAGGRSESGEPETTTLAESPDRWLEFLPHRAITGLRLVEQSRNDARITDRMSTGFVGGGRQWKVEGLRQAGSSEFWLSRWEAHDREAKDRRIWNVTYGLVDLTATTPLETRSLEAIIGDLRPALSEIRRFAEEHQCGGFTGCFDDALRALDDPRADIGYHKDLYPQGFVCDAAQSILKAAMSAWVFGGMGSWNDMSFDGDTEREHSERSDRLFNLLNEGIAAAASSTFPSAA